MPPLLRDSPLPLYYQIANNVRSRIQAGEWSPTERLPSEEALAKAFGVSALTVRQALGMITEEGLLRREQGRGSFVTARGVAVNKVRLSVPIEQITESMARLAVRLIDIGRVHGPRSVLDTLGLTEAEGMTRVRRVRLRGRAAVSYALAYLPTDMMQGITSKDLKAPLLLTALERKQDVFFAEVNQTIEASAADEDTAAALNVMVGSPVLLVRRTYALQGGRVAYIATNRYPSDLFRYEIRLERGTKGKTTWRTPALDGAAD